jgi:hypothetical protein
MPLLGLTIALAIGVWLTEQLFLLPIQAITTFHLPHWLSLAAVILGFTWLAAE